MARRFVVVISTNLIDWNFIRTTRSFTKRFRCTIDPATSPTLQGAAWGMVVIFYSHMLSTNWSLSQKIESWCKFTEMFNICDTIWYNSNISYLCMLFHNTMWVANSITSKACFIFIHLLFYFVDYSSLKNTRCNFIILTISKVIATFNFIAFSFAILKGYSMVGLYIHSFIDSYFLQPSITASRIRDYVNNLMTINYQY